MTFEIVGVSKVTQNGVSDASAEVKELLRERCRSRADLFEVLYEYAARNGYLGLLKGSECHPSLSVDFLDTDGGSYSVCVTFQANWELRRDDPDETYVEAYLKNRRPDDPELQDWRGSGG